MNASDEGGQTWSAIRPPPGTPLNRELVPDPPSAEALLTELLQEVRGLRRDITGLGHG